MTQTPTTKAAAAMIVQLDLAIGERLVNDLQMLALFDAHNNLLDLLSAGLSGESQYPGYDELMHAELERAQAALAALGVMGRPIPDLDVW